MTHDSAERRRRHADPARPVDEPTDPPAAAEPRPLSRRELRERGRGAGAATGGGASPSAVPVPGVWPAGTTPGATPAAPPPGGPGDVDVEAGQAVDVPAEGPVVAGADAVPTPDLPEPVDTQPRRPQIPAAERTPRMAETVPSDRSRYSRAHYLALALIACVLGYLIWALTTGAAEPGASSAGPAVSTTSPSAARTATQGEL